MTLPRVVLTKIQSSHNNLRTPSVEGTLVTEILEVGSRIVIYAEALELPFGLRSVVTSPICKIEGNRYWTENSEYELQFLREGEKQ